mmetsp:Transcript_30534/g.65782  ORF Transcript_30534/g.65782 Transcript_30534/m.65782 type:complete len:637 (+) Transcript_30534:186-2096(+)
MDDTFQVFLLLFAIRRCRLGVVLQPLQSLVHCFLHRCFVVIRHLGLDLFAHTASHTVSIPLELVVGFDLLALFVVLRLKPLGVLHHLLNVILRETALFIGDGDLVRLACGLIGGRHIQDAVGVQIEGDLDLGDASGSRRNAIQVELAQQAVVLGHGALALEDLDGHCSLVVSIGGEDLSLLAGDGRISVDQLRHDTASRFQAQRQGRHIHQNDVLQVRGSLTREQGCLHSSTIGDSLVRIDRAAGLLVEVGLDDLLDLRDSGGAPDEDHLANIFSGHLRVSEHTLDRVHGLLEEVLVQLFELGPSQCARKVDAINQRVHLHDDRVGRRKCDLCSVALSLQSTQGAAILLHIDTTVLAFELLQGPLHDAIGEVLPTEMRVASCGLHLEDAVLDLQERHVESAPTHVVDEHELGVLALCIQAVGQGCCCGFIDDSDHVQTTDGTCILGCLSLRVVEIGRNSDDSILHWMPKEGLGSVLHLLENHGRNLLWVKFLGLPFVLDLDHWFSISPRHHLEGPVLQVSLQSWVVVLSTNHPLCVIHSVGWVSGSLALGCITNEPLVLCESNIGRSSALALGIHKNLYTIPLPNSNAGIGRAEVNADHWGLLGIAEDWRSWRTRKARCGCGRQPSLQTLPGSFPT